METSAKSRINVDEIFYEAARLALKATSPADPTDQKSTQRRAKKNQGIIQRCKVM
jgi:GTPase SAR1 family protein